MALPRKHRLRLTRQGILFLRRSGKKAQTSFLSGFYLLADPSAPPLAGPADGRFAVVIGSHISKKATVRNRLRRLIYNAIIAFLPRNLKADMIVYPKKRMVELDSEGIKREIGLLLEKLNDRK